jgi:hypothetical protein
MTLCYASLGILRLQCLLDGGQNLPARISGKHFTARIYEQILAEQSNFKVEPL